MAGSWSLAAPSGILAENLEGNPYPARKALRSVHRHFECFPQDALSGRPFNMTDSGSMTLLPAKHRSVRFTDATATWAREFGVASSVKRTDRCFAGNNVIDPESVILKGLPLKRS